MTELCTNLESKVDRTRSLMEQNNFVKPSKQLLRKWRQRIKNKLGQKRLQELYRILPQARSCLSGKNERIYWLIWIIEDLYEIRLEEILDIK